MLFFYHKIVIKIIFLFIDLYWENVLPVTHCPWLVWYSAPSHENSSVRSLAQLLSLLFLLASSDNAFFSVYGASANTKIQRLVS